MKYIEVTGKTIDEAVESGLKELGKKRSQIEVKILEVPSKGIFGLFGVKLAKVRLNVIDFPEDEVRDFLEKLFEGMGIDAQIEIKKEKDTINVYLEGPDMGVIIGRRGQTLDAVQYLANLVVNKNRESYIKIYIDTENYRQKREDTLIRLANKMARKVQKIGKTMTLEPMNPYERRIIHASLQNNPYVQTYSEGEEPYRKVVVALRKDKTS
jgi:spoIIIJ-associated protein